MAESVIRSYFPSQVVSDDEKRSFEYGLKVAKAIENEWFVYDRGTNKFSSLRNDFHRLRLYARGEQSIQKYKDELSINGDLSYLNLDWKPVPIISKFVDIVVNGIAERTYDIKAYSQDPYGISKRTKYMDSILADMRAKELNDFAAEAFGVDLYDNKKETLPDTEEELQLHMQLSYKQAVELAEEQALNVLLDGNKYELTKRRFYYDLTVLGIGAVKTSFNTSEGVTIKYVDPANLVYSYTESPYFEDIYYVGEVKSIPVNELVKEFPNMTVAELEDIVKNPAYNNSNYDGNFANRGGIDPNKVQVLYFNYKTYMNEVYKVKTTGSGASKAIPKTDKFNPAIDESTNFEKLSRSVEVLYEGAVILGTEKLLKWELAKNMVRPKSDYTKVKMNYSIVAPRSYKGRIESLVGRITGFADMIQLTHLKLQQVMSRMVPDGIYLDADGLAEIDLGNGTNYNPQEALNMFFQTGSIIGRSFTSDGDMNPGKVPDKNALVGVQKLAAANSNTATRHILQSGLYLTQEVAESLSLRISDIIEYSPTKEAFIQAIGTHNVATLEEMKDLHLYDFGIFIELTPDEEEKAMLENNIQVALAQQSINLEDAIDLREIKNIKLANQLLKIRRVKKQQQDQLMQQQNIQAQSQANIQAQQASAQLEVQKEQVKTQSEAQLEQMKAQLEAQKQAQEVAYKKELMQLEFQMNMQLKSMEVQAVKGKDEMKEDRKDERTKIQATQQSELIDQRKMDKPPKNFESAGNDILGGGFDLGSFDPR